MTPLSRMNPASVAKAAVQSTDVDRIVRLAQAAYDALAVKDARTLYVIVG